MGFRFEEKANFNKGNKLVKKNINNFWFQQKRRTQIPTVSFSSFKASNHSDQFNTHYTLLYWIAANGLPSLDKEGLVL